VQRFKAKSEKTGKGYQALINEALSMHLGLNEEALTPEVVRKIVRGASRTALKANLPI